MSEKLDYETFLYISSNKLIISVNSEFDKKIYEKELFLDRDSNNIDLDKLEYLLKENIFLIEKKLKSFIKKIFIIIDLSIFFSVEISIKRNNHKNILNLDNVSHVLYEAKDCCKKTIEQKKIVHMIINNYKIDNKDYSYLPNNVSCNNFSLDVKFISISNKLINDLENILKKFQISISHIVSANYINKFILNSDEDVFLMAKKITNGYNPNEVKLVDKTKENRGFFEKFFNFFN